MTSPANMRQTCARENQIQSAVARHVIWNLVFKSLCITYVSTTPFQYSVLSYSKMWEFSKIIQMKLFDNSLTLSEKPRKRHVYKKPQYWILEQNRETGIIQGWIYTARLVHFKPPPKSLVGHSICSSCQKSYPWSCPNDKGLEVHFELRQGNTAENKPINWCPKSST